MKLRDLILEAPERGLTKKELDDMRDAMDGALFQQMYEGSFTCEGMMPAPEWYCPNCQQGVHVRHAGIMKLCARCGQRVVDLNGYTLAGLYKEVQRLDHAHHAQSETLRAAEAALQHERTNVMERDQQIQILQAEKVRYTNLCSDLRDELRRLRRSDKLPVQSQTDGDGRVTRAIEV